jgi:hypothetical protein
VAAAEVAMERLRRALDAGWDPDELRERYNAAASEKRAGEAQLSAAPAERQISRAELESYIDQLGDVAGALDRATPEHLEELYASLRLVLTYHHVERSVDVEIDPMADRLEKVCVRGGT